MPGENEIKLTPYLQANAGLMTGQPTTRGNIAIGGGANLTTKSGWFADACANLGNNLTLNGSAGYKINLNEAMGLQFSVNAQHVKQIALKNIENKNEITINQSVVGDVNNEQLENVMEELEQLIQNLPENPIIPTNNVVIETPGQVEYSDYSRTKITGSAEWTYRQGIAEIGAGIEAGFMSTSAVCKDSNRPDMPEKVNIKKPILSPTFKLVGHLPYNSSVELKGAVGQEYKLEIKHNF
jgi:hypothetical protein